MNRLGLSQGVSKGWFLLDALKGGGFLFQVLEAKHSLDCGPFLIALQPLASIVLSLKTAFDLASLIIRNFVITLGLPGSLRIISPFQNP